VSAPTTPREQRRDLKRRGRRRRRGGESRAPVPVQRVARAARATGDGTRRAWGAAWSGDRPMVVALLGVIVLSVLMVSGPAQRYLDSNSRVDALDAKAETLEAENERLTQRMDDLNDPEYVELMAREQQGFVRPGEVPYTLVPPDVDRPQIATPRDLGDPDPGPWYRRAWESVRGMGE
jgi:cell division protein FtsB